MGGRYLMLVTLFKMLFLKVFLPLYFSKLTLMIWLGVWIKADVSSSF